MAEEVLVAELRAGINRFEADLRSAKRAADRQSKAISDALNNVKSVTDKVPSSVKKVDSEFKNLSRTSTDVTSKTRSMSTAFSAFKGTIAALGLFAVTRQFIELGTAVVTFSEQLRSVNIQLRSAFGTAELATREFQFIKDLSDRLAIDTLTTAAAYGRLANAAKDTSIEGEGLRVILEGITTASAAFRLGNQRLSSVLFQVSQGLAKQKIQLEDLRVIEENGIPVTKLLGEALKDTGISLSEGLQKGTLGLEAFVLLAIKLLRDYSNDAERATDSVVSDFRRSFNTIRLDFSEFAKDLIDSPELKLFSSTILSTFIQIRKELGDIDFLGVVRSSIEAITKGFVTSIAVAEVAISFLRKEVNESIQNVKAVIDFFKSVGAEIGSALSATLSPFIGESEKIGVEAGTGLGEGFEESGKKGVESAKKTFLQQLDDLRREIAREGGFFPISFLSRGFEGEGIEAGTGLAIEKTNNLLEERLKLLDEIEKRTKKALIEKSKDASKELDKVDDKINRLIGQAAIRRLDDENHPMRRLIASSKELNELLEENEKRLEKEAQKAKELADEAARTGKAVLDTVRTAQEQQTIETLERAFSRAADNIQDAYADILVDVFSGQIPKLEDIADTIKQIFARTAAEIASAFARNAIEQAITPSSISAGGQAGGQGSGAGGGINVGGLLGAAGVGVGTGFLASNIAGQATGSSTAGNVLGGAAGGATAGAIAGSIIPGIGTAIGAVIGGLVGALGGGLASVFGGDSNLPRFDFRTTATRPPGSLEDNVLTRSPFGLLSLQGSASENIEAASVTRLISDLDFRLAEFLSDRQRQMLQQAFQTQFEVSIGEQEFDDAIAELVQHRLFTALEVLQGTEVATEIVGGLGTGTAENIQILQRRAQEALEILNLVEEFKAGPLSDTASAIKRINDEFRKLIDRANNLGLADAAEEFAREQQRQIREIRENATEEITQGLLRFTDPVAAEFAKLEKIQEERLQNLKDAGVSQSVIADAERLSTLEREELAERLNQANQQATQATNEGLLRSIENFISLSRDLPAFRAQQEQLRSEFEALRASALEAGLSVGELTQAFRARNRAIRDQAIEAFNTQLTNFRSPLLGQLEQQQQRLRDQYQALREEAQSLSLSTAGLARIYRELNLQLRQQATEAINQRISSFTSSLSSPLRNQLDQLELSFVSLRNEMRALGFSTKGIENAFREQRVNTIDSFTRSILVATTAFSNAFITAEYQVREQIEGFEQVAREGLLRFDRLDRFRRLALGDLEARQAVGALSGGNQSPIEQVADAFEAFVSSGGDLSNTNRQLFELTETFINLTDAAHILDLSTKDLEQSYLNQAKSIREQAIEAIDASLEPRRQQVGQIEQFLSNLRIGPELPSVVRIDEARQQFLSAAQGNNIPEAIRLGEELRQIARERFGGTRGFFTVRSEIQEVLSSLRDREQASIEAERKRLIRQEENQVRLVDLTRSSVDELRRIRTSNDDTSRGIAQLLQAAIEQNRISSQTREDIRRVLQEIGA